MTSARVLELEIATQRVSRYVEDDVLNRHEEAMDCMECQDWLQKGFEALDWLQSAEKTLREADYAGIQEFTPELRQTLYALYRRWQRPCAHAQEWIAKLDRNGYHPDNAAAFETACETVEDIIQQMELTAAATESLQAASASEGW